MSRHSSPHQLLTRVRVYSELIEFVVFRTMLLIFFLWGVLRLLGMDFGFSLGEQKANMIHSVSHEDVPGNDTGYGRH